MNNREFLYSLEPHELTGWFDAEHTSNDTLSAKKVVSAESVDANDGNAASLKDLSDDTQNLTDSREKLEADASELVADYAASGSVCDALYQGILALLNRQAAITERELCAKCEWPSLAAQPDQEAYDRITELQVQVDRLTSERDNLADDLLTCNREREHLREQLGIVLDHAHDICSLVDLDGNVLP